MNHLVEHQQVVSIIGIVLSINSYRSPLSYENYDWPVDVSNCYEIYYWPAKSFCDLVSKTWSTQ